MGASVARHALAELSTTLSEDRLHDARLIVTELVANAVRHGSAGGPVSVVMRWDRRCLQIEVHSTGPFHEREHSRAVGAGGLGLLLVDQLADRWGVRSGKDTTVWAEIEDHRPEARHRTG